MTKESRFKGKYTSVVMELFSLTIVLTVVYQAVRHGDFTIEEIAALIPQNPIYAVIIVMMIFALKSVSVVVPLALLYVSVGYVYSSPWAILLNLVGQVSALTVPYFIGKFTGTKFVDRLIRKYDKVDEIREIESENEYLTSYLLRMVGVLPSDLVSVYLGSLNMKYERYIVGSLLGLLPRMLAFTLLGTTGFDLESTMFWVMIMINVALVVVPIMYKKKLTANKDK